MSEPPVVYAHPNGHDYVAEVDGYGWVRWPAETRGWRKRQHCEPAEADWDELPERLSEFALKATGATP